MNRVSPSGVVNDTRRWTICAPGRSACDLNGDLRPQVNEWDPRRVTQPGARPDTLMGIHGLLPSNIGRVAARVTGGLVASVGYTRLERQDELGQRNVLVPSSRYIPLTVTEANSGRTITVSNRDPLLRRLTETVWDNESEMDSTYDGATISLNKRMSNGWMVNSGLSLGKQWAMSASLT